MVFINELDKSFIFDLKSNRVKSIYGKTKFKYINSLENTIVTIWLFQVILIKQTFNNKNGSTGKIFLVINDLNLTSKNLSKMMEY